MLFLGLDEAGYGPNFGPLVIGASAWRGPESLREGDWYAALAPAIVPEPSAGCIALADSKQLYQAGGTLAELECGVLAALAVLERMPRTWREIWSAVEMAGINPAARLPLWEEAIELPLPRDLSTVDQSSAVGLLQSAICHPQSAIQLLDLRARVIYPTEFNALVDRLDSKGALLSQATLELAAALIDAVGDAGETVFVACDKHGGRDRYAGVLQHVFPEAWIEPLHESRTESRYRFRHSERTIHFRFQVRGERFVPAALASMTAKYLRELAMLAFNAFWSQQIPALKPTAGYPEDAKRFLAEIRPAFDRLNLPFDSLWRKR